MSDVNEEQNDLDTTNNSAMKGKKASGKISKEVKQNLKAVKSEDTTADNSKEFNEEKYMENKRKRMKYVKSWSCTQKSVKEPKSYKCAICSKKFTKKDSMKRHIESVHTVQKFACQQCGKVYTRANTLKGHGKMTHEGKHFSCTYKNCDENSYIKMTQLITFLDMKVSSISYAIYVARVIIIKHHTITTQTCIWDIRYLSVVNAVSIQLTMFRISTDICKFVMSNPQFHVLLKDVQRSFHARAILETLSNEHIRQVNSTYVMCAVKFFTTQLL